MVLTLRVLFPCVLRVLVMLRWILMKLVCIILFVFLSSSAFAQACKVYGISDGPQKLSCSFKNLDIRLHCLKGRYYLNNSLVSDAFHMDVEEGASPLVFKTPSMQLTVIINSKKNIEGELEMSGMSYFGRCRF